ncbi:MAG: transporter substrate-binding domain-containing protein [Alphaproteobacteria bacterium]|nr:transporter substrate-binding domain-containing protein [Alphaproteobacteria bacterium]
MKLKLFIFSALFISLAGEAFADNVGIRFINGRGKIRCGANMSDKTYALKDEDGFMRGFAVDLCKTIATAIFDDSERYEIVDANDRTMEGLLNADKIDIMIGANALPASQDIHDKIYALSPILYDKQTLLIKKKEGAKSLKDYGGEKVCTVLDSYETYNMKKYIETYKLELNVLPFKTQAQAKTGLLLNRCAILTGDSIYLKALYKNALNSKDTFEIVPEHIAAKPMYAYVRKDNLKLQTTVEWIFNAIKLAEDMSINSKNIDVFIGEKDDSAQNLLGDNPKLWEKFELRPTWVRKSIKEVGNYGEIYERNIGQESDYKLERNENKLITNGGLITLRPFL